MYWYLLLFSFPAGVKGICAGEHEKENFRWSAAEEEEKEIGIVAVAAIETMLSGVSATDVNSHVSS